MPTRGKLPLTEGEWDTMAKTRGLQLVSIYNSNQALKSASIMETDQFLLLRVLFTHSESRDLPWTQSAAYHTAVASLDAQKSWALYLESTRRQEEKRASSLRPFGLFSLARYYQLQVCQVEGKFSGNEAQDYRLHWLGLAIRTRHLDIPTSSRTQPSETQTQLPQAQSPGLPARPRRGKAPSTENDFTPEPPAKPSPSVSAPQAQGTPSPVKVEMDEQIVNTALMVYLNSLTMCSEAQGEWSLRRKGFVLKSQSGEKVYEARVDGYLLSSDHGVKAIVEVKACGRRAKPNKIRMQEAGEMAAWIGTDPPDVRTMREQGKSCKRLLISQDGMEIYIIIAEFDADYVDYICDRPSTRRSFLKMVSYGPFVIDDPQNMSLLAHLMLAFTIDQSVLDIRSETEDGPAAAAAAAAADG